jgi:phosphomannomutase
METLQERKISVEQLMHTNQVKFGTSGVRGRVNDMTDEVCYVYVLGFIQYLKQTQQLLITQAHPIPQIALAGDLRESTPNILNTCAKAIIDSGYQVVNCGFIATPAVALYGLTHQCPAIMVTGSHIPDDRNGIKFYKLAGEILKEDELLIKNQDIHLPALFDQQGYFQAPLTQLSYLPEADNCALEEYQQRYLQLLPHNAFTGKKIGVYQHSGVARELISELLTALGAEVVNLGYAQHFIPVDTEAIREEDVQLAKQWVAEYQLDAIVSTDGDADRPLIADETGQWLRGDIIGFLCAHYLHIDHLVTPISSNTSVEASEFFVDVKRTRIGSPYVIAAMNEYVDDHYAAVAGYEANGGFLLATPVRKNDYVLTALPTRDAMIVLLTVLHSSVQQNLSLSQLCNQLPSRYTDSNRIKDFSTEKSQQVMARYNQLNEQQNKAKIEADFPQLGTVETINTLDGLRITFTQGDIIHFRASGNAPEFRCYSESNSIEKAIGINQIALTTVLSLAV